ncbi:MAG TPA: hypothetical protein VF334_03860 [Polyangia bacterium]
MRSLGRGLVELVRAPVPTAAALGGTVAGALAARAAWVAAGAALLADRPGRAIVTWLVGMSVAALVVDVTRAMALVAYAGPPRPLGRTLALGLVRTPGMISVRAVELLLYFALGLGELFVLARGLPRLGDPARQALLATACLAPALALGLVVFAASRIAQTVIARGLPPAAALAHGYDVTLRRFPSLARLGLAGLVASAPSWIMAIWVPAPLGALAVGVAALWLYAALTRLVGRDPRLALG